MFTEQELHIVKSEEVRAAIEQNITRNPSEIALDKRVPNASVVATQVKRLQRAASKLPTLYAVRAILPPLAYEQSSSELCAERKHLEGESALDLTCGLGIDSMALAKRFKRVVALERNEVLAEVVRENFRRLGVANVEVVTSSAEEYLESCTDHFDWCFVDPDRRGAQGEKLYRLEDCSPNIVALRETVAKVANRLCIKCSPLFDIEEAFRLFGDCHVEVVSLGGECKEVNIYLGAEASSSVSAVAIGQGEVKASAQHEARWSEAPSQMEQYRYLILPDVAIQHARLVADMVDGKADVWSNKGVALATQLPEGILGRVFEIEAIHTFDPKLLKRKLKKQRIEILKRDFALSNSEIAKRLGVKEGGDARWCFTTICRKMFAIELKN